MHTHVQHMITNIRTETGSKQTRLHARLQPPQIARRGVVPQRGDLRLLRGEFSCCGAVARHQGEAGVAATHLGAVAAARAAIGAYGPRAGFTLGAEASVQQRDRIFSAQQR